MLYLVGVEFEKNSCSIQWYEPLIFYLVSKLFEKLFAQFLIPPSDNIMENYWKRIYSDCSE